MFHRLPGQTWLIDGSPELFRRRKWRSNRLCQLGRHYYAGMPPLPKGKRLRNAEHFRRLVQLDVARWSVLRALRARFRASINLEDPKPKHGPKCGPGACPDCIARSAWRARVALRNGLSADDLVGMTGQGVRRV